MKLKFKLKKNARFHKQFRDMYETEYDYYWNETTKKWVHTESNEFKNSTDWHSSNAPCKSIRAFRRMLKKAPFGKKFILNHKYIGCDVIGFGSDRSFLSLDNQYSKITIMSDEEMEYVKNRINKAYDAIIENTDMKFMTIDNPGDWIVKYKE